MKTLNAIVETKREHIRARKAAVPIDELEQLAQTQSPPRKFTAALRTAEIAGRPGLIAEIKKASPSKGLIRADFDPASLAQAYEAGGATCISVLTDAPYFEGRDAYLATVKSAASLPVLRKDFMLEEYQVTESRALGADCILLIIAALDLHQAKELEDLALSYGMDVLIEVHDQAELEYALEMKSPLIGINNRNLKTMHVDLNTAKALTPLVPKDRLVVAESGISTNQDLAMLSRQGVSAFLVGESLMRCKDVEKATKALLGEA